MERHFGYQDPGVGEIQLQFDLARGDFRVQINGDVSGMFQHAVAGGLEGEVAREVVATVAEVHDGSGEYLPGKMRICP